MRTEDRDGLLEWGQRHSRNFPWREVSDPFVLAVTELMLVRTRAEQVAATWPRFFARFKSVQDLADAKPATVHELLGTLGLRWRADRIVRFARAAAGQPEWWKSDTKLPGVGPYVSRAVAIGMRDSGLVPVDVTIARVLSRYYGIRCRGEPRRSRSVMEAAERLGAVSRRFFHALLDHAALICVETSPRCVVCPIENGCRYARKEAA